LCIEWNSFESRDFKPKVVRNPLTEVTAHFIHHKGGRFWIHFMIVFYAL
jgi:hypothetical protein